MGIGSPLTHLPGEEVQQDGDSEAACLPRVKDSSSGTGHSDPMRLCLLQSPGFCCSGSRFSAIPGGVGSSSPSYIASAALRASPAGKLLAVCSVQPARLPQGVLGLIMRLVDPRASRTLSHSAASVHLADGSSHAEPLRDALASTRYDSERTTTRRSSRCGRPLSRRAPCTSCLPGRSPGAPGRTRTSLLVVRHVS